MSSIENMLDARKRDLNNAADQLENASGLGAIGCTEHAPMKHGLVTLLRDRAKDVEEKIESLALIRREILLAVVKLAIQAIIVVGSVLIGLHYGGAIQPQNVTLYRIGHGNETVNATPKSDKMVFPGK